MFKPVPSTCLKGNYLIIKKNQSKKAGHIMEISNWFFTKTLLKLLILKYLFYKYFKTNKEVKSFGNYHNTTSKIELQIFLNLVLES